MAIHTAQMNVERNVERKNCRLARVVLRLSSRVLPTHACGMTALSLALAVCAFGQTYTISTFAGGGFPDNAPAPLVALGNVSAIAVDSSGNVFMALPDYHIVAKMDSTSGLVTRVAGNGAAGFSGDGGPATSAELQDPFGVAVDSAGAIYIADGLADVIRKVSGGVITTVAGNGKGGFSGDNGPATSAQLNNPHGIAVDAAFNLFIADTGNLRIRMVSAGVITTVAGDGAPEPVGNGPAIGAHLFLPCGVAVDATGSLYIADTYNNSIRKVSGGTITTVAGPGTPGILGDGGPATSAELFLPYSVSIDSSGNLYIADTNDHRVRLVANGIISTLAGDGGEGFSGDGGPAAAAQLNGPEGVAVDAGGNVYIADSGNLRVRKVSAGIITTVAGHGSGGFVGDGGPAGNAQLDNPSGVAMDSQDNLYIADTGNHAIRMVSQGSITTVAGNGTAGYSGDGGKATSAQLNSPLGVAVDAAGNLYIADTGNNVVREVSGGIITPVAGNGTAGPTVAGPATSTPLYPPSAVVIDGSGGIYVATNYTYQSVGAFFIPVTITLGQVWKVQNGSIALSSSFTGYIGGLAVDPSGNLLAAGDGIWVDASGDIWTVDTGGDRIYKAVQGVTTTVAGAGPASLQGMPQFGGDGGPATSALLNMPMAVVTDSTGRAYIADSGNQRIRVLVPSTGCPATINWSSFQAGASGGNLTGSIVIGASCSWSMVGLPEWITVSGPATGSGPATVTLVVAANAGPPRTVTFGVAGNNVTVTQAGATYTVSGHVTLGGQPLPGVFMGLGIQGAGLGYSAQTDASGYYSIAFPAAASVYTLGANLPGYSFLTEQSGVTTATAEVLPFGNQTIDFTAWVNPAIGGLTAGFPSLLQPVPAAYAPGEIISIYGSSLCDAVQPASHPLPDALGGCTVWLGGTQLPLYYSSPGQINAVLPQNATVGGNSLWVQRYTDSSDSVAAAVSNNFSIQIAPVSMDFVEIADRGNTILAVQFQDGGFAGAARPVKPGDIVTLYLTGLGAKVQALANGVAPGVPVAAIQQPGILVESAPAQILYAGAQPDYPALDQIVLQLPQYALSAGKTTATFAISAPSVSQTDTYEVPAAQ